MQALTRCAIADIFPGNKDIILVGVIIGAVQRRKSSTQRYGVQDRYVFTFTVKDENDDSINITCSGLIDYVTIISETCKIGNMVEIHRPNIYMRQTDDYDADWLPGVSSPFKLTMDEKFSSTAYIYKGSMEDSLYEKLSIVYHIPLCSSYGRFTIAEICTKDNLKQGTIIDVLAGVFDVGTPRSFTNKYGKKGSILEIKLVDSSHATISLLIWDPELIEIASKWVGGGTMLYASHVKVGEDAFRNRKTLSTTQQTICTPQPETDEARELAKALSNMAYSGHLNEAIERSLEETNVSNFKTTYTVSQLNDCVNNLSKAKGKQTVLAKMNCYLEQMNLDQNRNFFRFKCTMCSSRLLTKNLLHPEICTKPECIREKAQVVPEFDLRVGLIDATGSTSSCRVTGDAAGKLLGTTVERILSLDAETLTLFKRRFLMEYFQVGVKVARYNNTVSVTVIDLKKN